MINIRSLSKKYSAFTISVLALLYEKFGDVVTLSSALSLVEHFKKNDDNLGDIDRDIQDFDDSYTDFLRAYGIELEDNSENNFLGLDFNLTKHDHIMKYEFIADDYQIIVEFNILDKTYKNYRLYRGSIDADYEVEPLLHLYIHKLLKEHGFYDDLEEKDLV